MNRELHLRLLTWMIESRTADKREAVLFRQGKANFQLSSSGHEALMAAFFLLEEEDYLYPHYRDFHLMLAKGLSLETIAKEFFAKSKTSLQGRNVPVHCGSKKYKIFPTAAPTASHCLPAIGTAWGQKLDKLKKITLCSIGDGSTRGGEFYEAVCYAVQNNLPIIFLIEDNHYAISTLTHRLLPFRLNIFNSEIFTCVDGACVFNIYNTAKVAIEKARNGLGPSILWCDLERLDSHTCSDNHKLYRSSEELENLRDPIKLYKDKLTKLGFLTEQEFEEIQQLTQKRVRNIYQEAILEPEPNSKDIKNHLYGPEVKHRRSEFTIESNITMVDAVNMALDTGLKTNNKFIVLGQDIEDPKGGVFGFTKGLSTKYPGRVINAPIAEATIIGSAVGLAVHGYKPVFEIQFIDFITPGFNQLVTNVSNLRWRSCSQWNCPLVFYAPYGAYLPSGGPWHSQSNDGWWTHIPGLRVAVPSTSEDTLGLFLSAFQDSDPSLILIPKHVFRIKSQINSSQPIRFGQAKIVKKGKDITIVGWGNSIELIQKASEEVKKQGISVEIIDLRTLVPCDWKTIVESLAKTGRLIVVQEDSKTSSFGSSIITQMVTTQSFFNYLYCAPKFVTRDDIYIPYSQHLEYTVLPSVHDIIKAISEILS